MKIRRTLILGLGLLALLLLAVQWGIGSQATAAPKTITLIHLSDVHGHMIPHDEVFPVSGNRTDSGGLAKLATVIGDVRADVGEENSLLLMVGDATHGGGEVLFTLGNAIMPSFNAFEIDVFTPGNWDFAYGARVFKNRFATAIPDVPLSANNQTTLSSTNPNCTGTASPAVCNVIAADFDTVANNVYKFGEKKKGADRKPDLSPGNRVLEPFVIKEANGVKVAVMGITSTRTPVQNPLFNLGFRFTKGFVELPQDIADAKAAGADIIVLMTELGLGDNLELVKSIPGVDVLLGADTHEELLQPIICTTATKSCSQIGTTGNVGAGRTIITEAGEDAFLGRLDLTIQKGAVKKFTWDLIEVNDEVPEDAAIAALVAEGRKTFVAGPDFVPHTFGPGGFPFGEGHTEVSPMETVVGTTEVLMERRDVIGDVFNNFIGDATLDAALKVAPGVGAKLDKSNAFAITNGFRFDIPILGQGTPLDGPGGGTADGEITVGELYHYMPFAPAVSLIEYSGGLLRGRFEDFLEGVFDPNSFRHRGGWWMGFSDNMRFVLDLEDAPTSVPLSTIGGRILDMTIDGNPWDPSKIYTMVSCYPHGEGTDRTCRTSGGRNIRFLCGKFEPDTSTPSVFRLCKPLNTENIVDVFRSPVVLQVAPDDFVAPVLLLREFLKTNIVTEAAFGPGRKNTEVVPFTGCPSPQPGDLDCDGVPDSEFGEVQPVQGAGPAWLGRE